MCVCACGKDQVSLKTAGSHEVSATSSFEGSGSLPRGDLERARSAIETGWAFEFGGDAAGEGPPSSALAFSRLARAL